MTIALTRRPSPRLESGERTHIGRDPIDLTRALAQHDAYRAALSACGVTVHRLDDADAFPDGVFIEDTAIVLDEVAVIMRPGAASRRPEVRGVELALQPYRKIERIVGSATLDGGDVVVAGRTIIVGRSARTTDVGIDMLRTIVKPFGYAVSGVGVHGCLHLKSGCTVLPDGRLIVNPAWIETRDLGVFDCLVVPSDEPWGGDVAIADGTVIAAAAYQKTLRLIEREGFSVKPVDVSEFAKAEGGVTCMSLIFTNHPA
jgi:dimethylargininase